MIVKFGDVVLDTKGKVDRNDNPYDYYIAGDHMDSEDFELHRKGKFATDDVGPAFIRTFKVGQVLYGSRRTYLKKIAVADFDGVTANTTFVLESKDESILKQNLLPFIMASDNFTKWSISKSKGSTNPYVLFSDLAKYEFNLPSLEKQEELAELLWSMEYTKRSYRELIAKTDELVKSQFIEQFGRPEDNHLGLKSSQLSDICTKITDGSHNPPKGIDASEYFMISSKNIINDSITLDDPRYLSQEQFESENKRTQIEAGDVLLTIVGTVGRCAVVPENHPNITLQRSVCVLHPKREVLNSYFLFYELKCMQEYIDSLAQGAAQRGIYLAQVGKLNVLVPDMVQQEQFVEFLKQSDKSKFELQKSLEEITAMQKKIINQNLS